MHKFSGLVIELAINISAVLSMILSSSTGVMGATDRPEIEAVLMSEDYLSMIESLNSLDTSIDIIEVPQSPASDILLLEGVDHDGLLGHFEARLSSSKNLKSSMQLSPFYPQTINNAGEDWSNPSLRIIFLNPIMNGNKNRYVPHVHPSTLDWLKNRFSVASLFIDCIVNVSYTAKAGDLCCPQYDQYGKIDRIDGFYRIAMMGGPTHVWFAHHLADKSSTYIISSCPQISKTRILHCATERNFDVLRRPMVVDVFIADAVSLRGKTEIESARKVLINYERHGAISITSEPLTNIFQTLHRLSQGWHLLGEDMVDYEERLEFMLSILRKIAGHYNGQADEQRTVESLNYLLSRIRIWRRWTANYNARTKIRIDLFFNLASQGDNHTNLEIATTSKTIAEETRKDSSSMITIAAMTMLFLPGTFVSAIFSTVFFETKLDQNGNPKLVVASSWWYFPAIALPLTALIMLIWATWQRSRGIRKGFIPATRGFDPIITGRIKYFLRKPETLPASTYQLPIPLDRTKNATPRIE